MPRDPDARYESLSQVLPFHTHEYLKGRVHTAFFGTVIEYDAATKRARIQPAPNMVVLMGASDRSMARSPILDIPVHQQGTGGYLVHQQIDKGDAVLCVVSERSLDEWKQRWGERYDPMPEILFDQQDAVALVWGDPEIAPAQEMGWIVQNADGDSYIWIMGTTVQMVSGSATFEVVNGRVNITAPGGCWINGIRFSTHVHSGVQTGGGVTGGPQ